MKSMAVLCAEYDKIMEVRKWNKEIPELDFHPTWRIKIIPPFAGAVVRFQVSQNNQSCSIYLDCYGNLGAEDKPYWEIYPIDGDTYRCGMNESEELIFAIYCSLNNLSIYQYEFNEINAWMKENNVDLKTPEGQVAFKLRWI